MDINRLIALNRYTRIDIYEMTGKKLDESPIVFVGNTLAERTVKNTVKSGKSVLIVGLPSTGKYTLAIKICDELGLRHMDSFDGSDFDDLPYIRSDWVYIVRNPSSAKTITKYSDSDAVFITIIDLEEGERLQKQFYSLGKLVKLNRPTKEAMDKFEKLKGYPMLITDKNKDERTETLIMKSLRGENIFPLPLETHRWLMFNLNNPNVMAICTLASHFYDDKLLYTAILKLIRTKQLINLRRPPWITKG